MKSLRKIYRSFSTGQCAVLLYHRVAELVTDPQLLSVTPDHFEAQLKYLKKKYHILSIEEFEDCLFEKKSLPDKSILISFDDGYADNVNIALPLLEQYETQALFYICTGNLNTTNEFWWDDVERLVLLSDSLPGKIELMIKGEKMLFAVNNHDERLITYNKLLPLFRSLNVNERNIVINELGRLSGMPAPRESHRSMTFDKLRKMSASKASVIGAHTHNHPSLAALSIEEQKHEINKSKKILEDITGKKIKHFSYPFGTYLDYNSDTINICKESGFSMVAANYPDTVDKASNLMMFPRFLVRDWDEKVFSENIRKFFSIL